MSSDWPVFPLEECLDALIDYRGKTPEKTTSGIPLITAKIIKAGRIETPTEFIAVDNYDTWMRRGIPKAGDVVLTVEAPLGEVAQLGPEKIALAQRVVTLRGKSKLLDSTFLLYLLQSEEVQRQLRSRATGTTVLGIKQSELRKVLITVPPLDIQVNAATTLKILDDRITLLHETNATLEAICQALFKSWFVDFDPVCAKAKGHIPEGLDEATAALFPDSFENSPMGMIPTGWRAATLSEVFEINPSRLLKKGATAPYIDMASLGTSGHCVSTPVQREVGSGAKFKNGDTLLARITPCLENGKSAFVDFLEDEQIGWGSTEFLVLRPKAPLPVYLGYLLSRYAPFREHAILSMSGTSGRQRIQNDVLGRYMLAVPGEKISQAFDVLARSIQCSIAEKHRTTKTLEATRNALLPRLVSGKIRLGKTTA